MGVARLGAVTAALALGCTSDLFHSTQWSSACDDHSTSCPAANSGAGSGGASSTATGGASGPGGSGVCTTGQTQKCYDGPQGTEDVGVCKAGSRICDANGTWQPCKGEVTPEAESCASADDDNCDGAVNESCVYASCAEVPMALGSGVYSLGPSIDRQIETYCDLDTAGGGWALLYSSNGSATGETTAFWNIAYADRLTVKGTPSPIENFYAGALYPYAKEVRDEIEDLAGTKADVIDATFTGFDTDAMAFQDPAQVSGDIDLFVCHVASGWSSSDHDGDTNLNGNCAADYADVSQHYCACWRYNLGADADDPHLDSGWGPHVSTDVISAFGFMSDGTPYSRVKRISRWVRW